jgi:2-aminoadipate transaminase
MYSFEHILSNIAQSSVKPYSGLPRHHFVGGNIDEPSVPIGALSDALVDLLQEEGHHLAKYGMDSGMQGYLPLREQIARMLGERAGMTVSAEEVLLTTGSLQAMDLVNKALLNAGDVVLIEAENYAGTLTKLNALGVDYIGIKTDDHGMCPQALRDTLHALGQSGRKPKYIFTIPTVQNPTGTVMPLERRNEILALAREFDVPIFEDDCYADLVFSGNRPPALHALDTEGRVLYCGTFSKTIAPALRVGYLVAKWPLMGHILPLKTDAGSGALEQMLLAKFLPQHFDQHVKNLLPMLESKANSLCDALDEHFGSAAAYTKPVGGIYLWVTLPEHVDTEKLLAAALAEGIEINPGPHWAVDKTANKNKMRICFGHPTHESIKEGIKKLAAVCHQEFGVPLTSSNTIN